ncbi:alpha/beta fold hydrolase [Elizabethkingia meningoseptica]|uniref:alpha/beta fold hydrolase n=1 Tax=Elizabethkingia meningoseptica TaxID=238 RepID=UPI00301719A1
MKWYKVILLVLLATNVYSQTKKQLQLFAVGGPQMNKFDSGFNTNVNTEINSFALGAGSHFYIGNFFWGTTFQFFNGSRQNVDDKLSLSGMNSVVSAGYNLLSKDKLKLAPSIGFASLNNKITKDDIKNNKSEYFNKNNFGLVPALDFSYINHTGLFYGIRIGYNIDMNSGNSWKNGINKTPSAFTDNTNSFFIQFKLGGVLDIKKKNKQALTNVSIIQSEKKTLQMNTSIIDNKGDKLFTTIYPNTGKETVILLHGGPGFPSDLKEVVETLKDNFQIITFHQRGTKKSPCISKDYSMEAYLSDIEVIRKFYKTDKFHLWGHSWGGLYAQIYAEKHPENLLSLFLCSPGSGTNVQWKQTEKEVMQLNRFKSTGWQWAKMGMNSFWGTLGSDEAYKRLFKQVMKNYNEDFIETEMLSIDFDNLKATPINRTRPEIVKYPLLNNVTKPGYRVTILYGDQDIYKSSKDFVIKRYPTADIYTIPNSGHLPWLHNPQSYKVILAEHYRTNI